MLKVNMLKINKLNINWLIKIEGGENMDWEKQRLMMDWFRRADRNVKRCIEKKVEHTGVYRSQHRLLMMLGRNPNRSQSEIAEKMDISPAAVAVSLKKLEKSGYISRQCDENDNRVNSIEIMEKGKMTISVSEKYFREINEALLEGFSEEELFQFESFMRRIVQNGECYYQTLLKQEKEKGEERE